MQGLIKILCALSASIMISGCKMAGTVIYDLETGKQVTFIKNASKRHYVHLFVQKNLNTPSFWMSLPYPTEKVHMNFCEYDFDGTALQQFDPHLERYFSDDISISPNHERLVYFNRESVPAGGAHQWKQINNLMTKRLGDANSTIILENAGRVTLHKQSIFWLTNDEAITAMRLDDRETFFILKLNASADITHKLPCRKITWASGNAILPSPDGRHLLVNFDDGKKIGIVDIATMTFVKEVELFAPDERVFPQTDFTWINNHEFVTYFYEIDKILQYNIETSQLTSINVPFPADKYRVIGATERFFILRARGKTMWEDIWSFDRETSKMKKICSDAVGPVYKLSETRILIQNAR